MTTQRCYDLTLQLRDITGLFHALELDPFAAQASSVSGIDQLINELKPKSLVMFKRF